VHFALAQFEIDAVERHCWTERFEILVA
jgi:hypothetical protein